MSVTRSLIDLYRKLRPLQILPESNEPAAGSVRVLTYNLLAQHHMNIETYPYCRPGVLRWTYRRERLLAELQAYGPTDLMAFQEVSNFEEFWKEQWKNMMGEVSFVEKEGGRDGLAIVYNSTRFTLIHEEVLSFAPLMCQIPDAHPNLAQITCLHDREIPNHTIIISNTHLYWHPEFHCLRVLQAHRLRRRIEELAEKNTLGKTNSVSVVMCGDWNSTPDSLLYRFMTRSQPISPLEWNEIVNQHIKLLSSPSERSRQLFQQVQKDFESWRSLASAYANYRDPCDPSRCGEPEFTSVTPPHLNTLDYIFYSDGLLKPSELLLLPPSQQILLAQTGLPNEIYASDHLALAAKFQITNERE